MTTCGSLKHIFEKPLQETSSTLLESLSPWNQIISMNSIDDIDSSFTEIFGELHFKEKPSQPSLSSSSSSSTSSVSSFSSCLPPLSASSSLSSLPSSSSSSYSSLFFLDSIHHQSDKNERNKSNPISNYYSNSNNHHHSHSHKINRYKHSDSFSSKTSDSLSLCTEGLGFESSDDVEDVMNDLGTDKLQRNEERNRNCRTENQGGYEYKRSRISEKSFPPPISCIGKSGKPWVCFKSFRQDGRFILKEIRIPTQELMHACREDGRLKLHFVQSDDEILDDEDEDDDDDELENVEEEPNEDENLGEENVGIDEDH